MDFPAKKIQKTRILVKTGKITSVHRFLFVFDCIPDQYKTQEICDRIVSLHPFSVVYCPDNI